MGLLVLLICTLLFATCYSQSTACTKDVQCPKSGFCSVGSCRRKGLTGGACLTNNQCDSNICTNSICSQPSIENKQSTVYAAPDCRSSTSCTQCLGQGCYWDGQFCQLRTSGCPAGSVVCVGSIANCPAPPTPQRQASNQLTATSSLINPLAGQYRCEQFVTCFSCTTVGCQWSKQAGVGCRMTCHPSADYCVDTADRCASIQSPCNPNPCPALSACVPEPKMCVSFPCPQYSCLTASPDLCPSDACPSQSVCIPEPKNCFSSPCLQYRCEGPGAPPVGCNCVQVYAPVCSNNVEYNNACEANCMGVPPTKVIQGRCMQAIVTVTEGSIGNTNPLSYFSVIQGNAIQGNNDVSISNVYSADDCARACIQQASSLPCQSFDFQSQGTAPAYCVLSKAISPVIAATGWNLYLLTPNSLPTTTTIAAVPQQQQPAPMYNSQQSTQPVTTPGPPPGYQCGCLNAYYPVCYNGYTFNNPCEAACNGIIEGYTQGQCYQVGTVQRKPPPCVCAQNFAPVCSLTITFPNECQAICLGFGAYVAGQCGAYSSPNTLGSAAASAFGTTAGQSSLGTPAPGACYCAQVYNPVCVTGNITLPNLCDAHCKRQNVTANVACQATNTTVNNCGCKLLQEICANGKTLKSPCEAECYGFPAYTLGACNPNATFPTTATNYNYYTTPVPPQTVFTNVPIQPDNPACNCARTYQPVCSSAKQVSYNNACQATCAGQTQILSGLCGQPSANLPSVMVKSLLSGPAAPQTYDCAKCFSYPLVSVCARTKTFGNGCYAYCAGFTVYSTGACAGYQPAKVITQISKMSTGSCLAKCGTDEAVEGCFCSAVCVLAGNCCSDYGQLCSVPVAAQENPSCKGLCGGQYSGSSSYTCHCDTRCVDSGDCCMDYGSMCTASVVIKKPSASLVKSRTTTVTLSTTSPSCYRQCGTLVAQSYLTSDGITLSCHCDLACMLKSDCCSDFTALCLASEPRASCRGKCEDDASGGSDGCFCDHTCVFQGDCCADYVSECAAGDENAASIVATTQQGN